jgi:tRNA 2-selenouridine synthase
MSSSSTPRPSSGRIPTAPIDAVLRAPDRVVIDLRSPAEYEADHVPGAVNVPLFDDVERAVIGTLYRQHSPEAAFEEGRERTLARIESLVREIGEAARWKLPGISLEGIVDAMCAGGIGKLEGRLVEETIDRLPEAPVALYCWRGGLRSRSVTALLGGLGLDRALCIAGGYKAYRRHVRERLEVWTAPPTFVLRGLTGVGKTLVLRELERIRPGWTLDLEELAGHRSSILGMVGLRPCTQKTFDSRLLERLERGFPGVCVVEGESRKVGDVILPAKPWTALCEGTAIELVAPEARRVTVLVEDYLEREENRSEIAARLPFIEARLGSRKWEGVLVKLLAEHREEELVQLLLEHYYDPLYHHSEGKREYAATIDTGDPLDAAMRIAEWIEGVR